MYGVSHNTIARIIHFETWAWLKDDGSGMPDHMGGLPPLSPEEDAALDEEVRASAARLRRLLGKGEGKE